MNKKIEGLNEDFQELGTMLNNIDFSEKTNKDEIYDRSIKNIKCKEGKNMIKNKYKKISVVAASLLLITTVLVRPTWAEDLIEGVLNTLHLQSTQYMQMADEPQELPDFYKGKVFDKDGNPITKHNSFDKDEKMYTADGKEIYELKNNTIITMDEKDDYKVVTKDKDTMGDYFAFTPNMPEYMTDDYKFEEARTEKYDLSDTKEDFKSMTIEFKNDSNNSIFLWEYKYEDKPVTCFTKDKIEKIKINGEDAIATENGEIGWDKDGISYSISGDNVDREELIKIAESIK